MVSGSHAQETLKQQSHVNPLHRIDNYSLEIITILIFKYILIRSTKLVEANTYNMNK